MASWSDFPVVRFAPSTRVREGEQVQWLLWPALAWRVIGPRPRERTLNLFQRSVLGLLCAGRRTAEEIALRLCLHRELVALVIHELEQMRALDALQRPTAQGQKLFAEDQDDEDELVVGRVFADPFSGELWPRLVARDLPGVAIERSDSGWPIMETGTQGAPRRDRPFVVEMPIPRVERAPQPAEILRAARAHARQIRHGEDAFEEHDRPARLERVECLSARPEEILLAVRARVGSSGWSIDDPFGVGESPRMRAIVERRIGEERAQRGQSALRDRLQPRADDESAQTLKELQRRAESLVEDRLTLAIHAHPELFERLVAMQRAGLEAAQSDSPYDKREDVAVKAQQAIEHVLGELLRRHGRRDDHRSLMPDKRLNALLFQKLAEGCGFDRPMPRNLAGVRPGKVQSAVESCAGSLLPLLLALLLGTPGVEGHPLRRAGARSPSLLDDLARLATLRDGAAHGGRRAGRQNPPPIDVIEVAYGAIEQLLLDP
jgi:hypothetical protein